MVSGLKNSIEYLIEECKKLGLLTTAKHLRLAAKSLEGQETEQSNAEQKARD